MGEQGAAVGGVGEVLRRGGWGWGRIVWIDDVVEGAAHLAVTMAGCGVRGDWMVGLGFGF